MLLSLTMDIRWKVLPPTTKPKDYYSYLYSKQTQKSLNNFGRYIPNNQKNIQSTKKPNPIDNHNKNPPFNLFNNPKQDLVPEPGPYIVIQATRLRINQAKNEVPIELSSPKITTKQGLPTVIFRKDDFMVKLANRCKFGKVQ